MYAIHVIYIIDAIFSNGFATVLSTGVREPLNSSNSVITKLKQADVVGKNIAISKVKTLTADCGVDKNGYAYERGSCDLNKK